MYLYAVTETQSSYSSLLSEKAFVRAALSDRDCQQVHGDVRHRHSVHVGETGGPGWPCGRGRIVDGLSLCGDDSRSRTALWHPVSPVFFVVLRYPGLVDRRPTTSPARHLVTFPYIWTIRAAVGHPGASGMFLLTVRFGCNRGLLLKPLGQLHEAVIWRLTVVMHAPGHFGQTVSLRLLEEPAPFGERLCRTATTIFIIM